MFNKIRRFHKYKDYLEEFGYLVSSKDDNIVLSSGVFVDIIKSIVSSEEINIVCLDKDIRIDIGIHTFSMVMGRFVFHFLRAYPVVINNRKGVELLSFIIKKVLDEKTKTKNRKTKTN